MSTYQKKNVLIGGLLAVVVVMGIAYAAFASNLSITGTSSTTNNWGVRITSITPTSPSVNATCSNTSDPSTCTTTGSISHSVENELTARFSASLISPGDSVTYTITVENYGGLDAKLDTLNMPSSSNPAISFLRNGLDESDVITAGNTKTFTVTVTYVNSENQGQPASTFSNFSLTLNFVQDDGTGGGSSSGYNGTVYAWNTSEVTVGTSTINDLVSTKTTNPYYTSAANVMSDSGYSVFNKYTVVNDTITGGYTCQTFGISGFEPVCVRGGEDTNNVSFYNYNNTPGNWAILNDLNDNNASFTGSCTSDTQSSECALGHQQLRAYLDANVYADDYDFYGHCYVYRGGNAGCF